MTGGADPPFAIVSQLPGRPWPARALSAVRVVIGMLIVLVGLVLAIPALALLIILPIALVTGGETTGANWALLVGLGVGAAILMALGLRIMRGRRHLVLFLRKFGFGDASEALTFAVSGALGRRWRLVTLDDSQVEAVGVGRGTRVAWGLGRWLTLAALVLVIFLAARWWFGGGIESTIDGIFEDARAGSGGSGASGFAAAIGAIVVGLIVTIVVLALMLLLIFGAISTLGVATIGAWRADRAVRRAEGDKALAIADAHAVEPTVARVLAGSRGIQAPRLVVLKVADAVWRDVVLALADEATVAVVDVSDPTEHLLWEVATLQGGDVRARPLLIGRRDRVEALAAARGDDAAGRLRERLRCERVVVYDDPDDRRGMQRFARTLAPHA
ncbi:MAG: hypothetical protein O3B31_01295 [Chloroflexi bacterium]|nr:hypothetical protein [Chloroflexota bacterium]MDA1001976.1 hypothetical protein [Chloroflexota bacterium]